MSNNITLQGLGLTSINDPRLAGTTDSSAQQRPFYKRKIRPKKHERLHNDAAPNDSPMRDGLSNSERTIGSPPRAFPGSNFTTSNGQIRTYAGFNHKACIMKSESSYATKSPKPTPDTSTPSDGPHVKRVGIATTGPPGKRAVMTTYILQPGKAPVTSTSPIAKPSNTPMESTNERKESSKRDNPPNDFGDSTNSDRPNVKQPKKISIVPPFSWEIYLKFRQAEVAPKEAFMQTHTPLINRFEPKMKLEARDPRNRDSWCLASVVTTDSIGPRVKLRFEGSDGTNDFYELIDSGNIRPYGTSAILHPPVAYKGNIAHYPRFVDKVMSRLDSVIAPPNCFVTPPPKPESNLFKEGMKLEAIDRKNPYLICPATVGAINGKDIKIVFDGWSGSFDYYCPYHSRDIFPVNWCQNSKHYIAAPNGWEQLFGEQDETKKSRSPAPKLSKLISTPNSSNDSKANLSKTKNSKGRRKEVQKMTTSTPKRNTPKQRLQESINDEDEDQNTTIDHDETPDDNLYDLSGIPKFQCQRTVPYCEWLKLKNNVSADVDPDMPSTTVSSEQPTQSNCPNVIDSSSQQSTMLQPSEEEPIPKKPKTDHKTEIPESRTETDKTPSLWTVGDVSRYLIKSDESLVKYVDVFENHEIDGKAFLLLSIDIMMTRMGLKVGPALKINNLIEQIQVKK